MWERRRRASRPGPLPEAGRGRKKTREVLTHWRWIRLLCCPRLRDSPHDLIQTAKNLLIGDSENRETAAAKRPIAACILGGPILVDRPVDFDDERGGMAIEVGDVPVDHLLSAELEPAEALCSKGLPHQLFRGHHFPAKLSGSRDFF
jgi:hypothetical protein